MDTNEYFSSSLEVEDFAIIHDHSPQENINKLVGITKMKIYI